MVFFTQQRAKKKICHIPLGGGQILLGIFFSVKGTGVPQKSARCIRQKTGTFGPKTLFSPFASLFSTFSFDLSPFWCKTSFLAFLVKFLWGQSGRLSVRGEGYTPNSVIVLGKKHFPYASLKCVTCTHYHSVLAPNKPWGVKRLDNFVMP